MIRQEQFQLWTMCLPYFIAPCPIILIPSTRLGSDKYQFLCHWLLGKSSKKSGGLNPTTYQLMLKSFGHHLWSSSALYCPSRSHGAISWWMEFWRVMQCGLKYSIQYSAVNLHPGARCSSGGRALTCVGSDHPIDPA